MNEGKRVQLTDMACPSCGANLKYEPGSTRALCEYCGSYIHIDTFTSPESELISAEEAGYRFERGRQRARDEARLDDHLRAMENRGDQPYYQAGSASAQKPSRGKILLYIIGFLLCFPVPVTILALKSKRLPVWAKILIVVGAWLTFFFIMQTPTTQS